MQILAWVEETAKHYVWMFCSKMTKWQRRNKNMSWKTIDNIKQQSLCLDSDLKTAADGTLSDCHLFSRKKLTLHADSIISQNLIQILNPCCALFSSKESLLYLSALPLKLLLFALHAVNENPKWIMIKKKKKQQQQQDECLRG